MPTSTPRENDSVASSHSSGTVPSGDPSSEGPASGGPAFESPINKTYPAAVGALLSLGDESEVAKIIVRTADGTRAADQLGVAFGASRRSDSVLICGQRPTEWLVIGTAEAAATFVDGLDLTGHVSVIDHTHSRALFRLTGDRGRSLLEKVCSLDWSDQMMPDGAVCSASLAKVTVDLVRNDVDGERSYLIACDRSFAQYLFDAIVDAGQEFGIDVNS